MALPFALRLVDQDGVPAPCVALRTTDDTRFVSDAEGWVAIDEPGLEGEVWFGVSGRGVSLPADGFGYVGFRAVVTPGEVREVALRGRTPGNTCGVDAWQREVAESGFSPPFRLTVRDAATGRGVPLVRVDTPAGPLWSDSAGHVAIREPLLGREGTFTVASLHGYAPAGPPLVLAPAPGGGIDVDLVREQPSERLYRVTGRGVYRDSVLLGLPTPTEDPVADGRVMGQDTLMVVPTPDGPLWLWGDTERPEYPLGNFQMSGAWARPLPDPADGVDLDYFVDGTGFSRPMAPTPGAAGPVWLAGPALVDDGGVSEIVAFYGIFGPDLRALERGTMRWDPGTATFVRDRVFSFAEGLPMGISTPLAREGFAYLEDGLRFPATLAGARDPLAWERWTPYDVDGGLALDADGEPAWAWRPVGRVPMAREPEVDGLRALEGRDVVPHGDSIAWSPWRRRWQRLFTEDGGERSWLGDLWYAEADTPLGPWSYAARVAVHDDYTFYNPVIHAELAGDGRALLWEGTYTAWLATDDPTPRYDYNQLMYRQDLEDPRLVLPLPVYAVGDALRTADELGRAPEADPIVAFLAPDRGGDGLRPVGQDRADCAGGALAVGEARGLPAFYVADGPRAGTVPLRAWTRGAARGLGLDVTADAVDGGVVGHVWARLDGRRTPVAAWRPEVRLDAGPDRCVAEPADGEGAAVRVSAALSGAAGGRFALAVDGVQVATTAQATLRLAAGDHVVVATWWSDAGTPIRDAVWVAVAAGPAPSDPPDDPDDDPDRPGPEARRPGGCGCVGPASDAAPSGGVGLAAVAAVRRRRRRR